MERKKKAVIFYPSWMKVIKAIGDSRKTLCMKELLLNSNGTYSTISSVLKLFEKQGLVVMVRHSGTDREVQIILTSRGRLVWSHLLNLENELGVKII